MLEKVRKILEHEYAAQKSDEWLRLRGKMLTASDAAVATGTNPYSNETEFILSKCGHRSFFGNDATRHGEKYEDEARDKWCEMTGEVSHEIGLYQHPVHDWLGGSPDGITESGKLIEIKCPLKRHITSEVPIHYMPQLQLLMDILDLDEAVFIQYKPYDLTWPAPEELVITRVPRDPDWMTTSLPKMRALWDKVLWHRENGVDALLKPKKTRKPYAARKNKSDFLETCEIAPTLHDEEYEDM
jgi:putative phage-type endonuclease